MKSSEDDDPVTTHSPVEAEWDYPMSKLAAEAKIRGMRGDIPALILRIAGVYDEDCHSVPIAQQIGRIHQKKLESYLFPGDTTHGQSFVHLDDLVECIGTAISRRRELPPLEVLLIGEEEVMSYGELLDCLGKLIHGQQWPTIRIPKTAAKAGAWVKDKMASDDDAPLPPGMQNDIVVGLLLLMVAIVPNNASQPPRSWFREPEGTLVVR